MKQQYSRKIRPRENFTVFAFNKVANRLQPMQCSFSHGFPSRFPNLVFDLEDTISDMLVNLIDKYIHRPIINILPNLFPLEIVEAMYFHNINESFIPLKFLIHDIRHLLAELMKKFNITSRRCASVNINHELGELSA